MTGGPGSNSRSYSRARSEAAVHGVRPRDPDRRGVVTVRKLPVGEHNLHVEADVTGTDDVSQITQTLQESDLEIVHSGVPGEGGRG